MTKKLGWLATNFPLNHLFREELVRRHRAVEPDRSTGAGLYRVRLPNQEDQEGGWSRLRRVVVKAEHIEGKENPRFVVTSLDPRKWVAQALYEQLYCARGDRENRIKEQFSLFADRVSTETMRANQMRLYLSAMAYVLVSGLRRLGLKATGLAEAQVSTIRTKLLKIGAQIRVTVRKVWVSMASSYPSQDLYRQVWANLRC